MTTLSNRQVRRATVDDLVVLRRLWARADLPLGDLEKRLTEFQVVETPAGELLGSVGLHVHEQHGRIHSEVYADPGQRYELRPRLWDRLQAVARCRGLARLWVEHNSAEFWTQRGFELASAELVKQAPVGVGLAPEQIWLSLKLRDEQPGGTAAEQELALLRLAQETERERVQSVARLFRAGAALVVFAMLLMMAAAAWYILRNSHYR